MIRFKLALGTSVVVLGFGLFAWAVAGTIAAGAPYRVHFPLVVQSDLPSPTATPAPTPTPNPIAGLPVMVESPLEVVSFRELVTLSGSRVILGEVKNRGTTRSGVSIRYGYYRGTTIVLAAGAVLLPPSTSLAPGGKAPFHFYVPTENWDRWELTIKPTIYTPRTSDDPYLVAADVQVEEKWGGIYVKGEIRNNGPSVAKSVRVGVTGYDNEGIIVATDYGLAASSDIPEGMGALFNVWVTIGRPQDMRTYELRLTSSRD